MGTFTNFRQIILDRTGYGYSKGKPNGYYLKDADDLWETLDGLGFASGKSLDYRKKLQELVYATNPLEVPEHAVESFLEIWAILASFTHIVTIEKRNLVAPDFFRKFRLLKPGDSRRGQSFSCRFSPTFGPLVGSTSLRYVLWGLTFFVRRTGNLYTSD
jgi:hypothetical protein